MGLPSVRLRETAYDLELEVVGVGAIPIGEDGDGFVGPIEIARRASLTSLRRALIAHGGTEGPQPREFVHPETNDRFVIPAAPAVYHSRLEVVDVAAAKFSQRHTYEFVPEPVSPVIRHGGALAVLVQVVIEAEEEPDSRALERALAPLLNGARAKVDYIDTDPQGPLDFRTRHVVTAPDFWVVNVYITLPIRGRDVEFALRLGYDALAVLEATERGTFAPHSAVTLLEAGRAAVLLGQPETAWLECKSQLYADTEEGSLRTRERCLGLRELRARRTNSVRVPNAANSRQGHHFGHPPATGRHQAPQPLLQASPTPTLPLASEPAD